LLGTRGAATIVVATMVLIAGACTSDGGKVSISAPPSLRGTLVGSGSTFQSTFQQQAIASFKAVQPGITIRYEGGGSGKGRANLAAGVVNFAGSDTAPIPDSELANFKGRAVLYFPVLIGPITVAYNLPGIRILRLSGPVIAGIFQGTITHWNDPAIHAENPGVALPGAAITIVHRSDSSGTTQNFSQFLVDSASQVWKLGSGSIIQWPAASRSAKGNAGVASVIKNTPDAVGYVDLADAKQAGLTFALIKNKAGLYIVPSAISASAAAGQVSVKPNLTFSAIWAPGTNSYPITFQSWDLVYAEQPNATDVKLLLAWLGYLVGAGQDLVLGLNYAPLPSGIGRLAAQQLRKISS